MFCFVIGGVFVLYAKNFSSNWHKTATEDDDDDAYKQDVCLTKKAKMI